MSVMDVKAEAASVVRSWLRQLVLRSGLTPEEIARRSGVSATTITRPLNESSIVPNWASVYKIAAAMHELPPLPASETVPLFTESDWVRINGTATPARIPAAVKADFAIMLERDHGPDHRPQDILFCRNEQLEPGRIGVALMDGKVIVGQIQRGWLLPHEGTPVLLTSLDRCFRLAATLRPS
jgi:transcriptional regulator with XRE-family HTH domain